MIHDVNPCSYQTGLPAPEYDALLGTSHREIGQVEPGFDQDGGLFAFSGLMYTNTCTNAVLVQDEYKVKLYAKDTYHIYLNIPELAAPRKVYFGIKSTFCFGSKTMCVVFHMHAVLPKRDYCVKTGREAAAALQGGSGLASQGLALQPDMLFVSCLQELVSDASCHNQGQQFFLPSREQ